MELNKTNYKALEVISNLSDFINYECMTRSKNEHFAMNFDDLKAECYQTVLHIVHRYGHAEIDTLTKISRVSITNRLNALHKRYFRTGRKIELQSGCFEDDFDITPDAEITPTDHTDSLYVLGTVEMSLDPAIVYDSLSRIVAVMDSLDEETLRVFKAIMESDNETAQLFKHYAAVKSATTKNPTIKITHKLLSESLRMNLRRISECMQNIKTALHLLSEDA